MSVCVAYDLTRLFFGPVHTTPRGIDRVELGFAKHFLKSWRGEAVATLPTPLGVRVFSRQDAYRIVWSIECQWGELLDPDRDFLLDQVLLRLRSGKHDGRPLRRRSGFRQKLSLFSHVVRNAGCVLGPSAAEAVPRDAVFFSAGQLGIAVPMFLAWLKRRPDVKPIFMLHDLIPLECGQFVPRTSQHFHGVMVKNVVTHAAGLITTTQAAASAIRKELKKRGRTDLPVLAEALPVAPAFVRGPCPDPRLSEKPYFMIVGSIEPRKNHALLLKVWQDLLRHDGSVPKLVIAGTRWRGHEAVTRLIRENKALRESVVEVNGLSTPALRHLMSNARGILMPSFAEGFGLPIIEAQALGVPVIASDLPAHREAGGPDAIYLDPTDESGWAEAIRMLAARPVAHHAVPKQRDWQHYLGRVEPFVERVAATDRVEALTAMQPTAA